MSARPDFLASRRIVFQGLGALGVAAVLAGCGGGDESANNDDVPASGSAIATAAEVPVGGGIIVGSAQLVITQPTEGEFKAFSTRCTHTGTPVNEVDGAEIVCPNHGSRFSITDGSALNGPASNPLESVEITVADGEIQVA